VLITREVAYLIYLFFKDSSKFFICSFKNANLSSTPPVAVCIKLASIAAIGSFVAVAGFVSVLELAGRKFILGVEGASAWAGVAAVMDVFAVLIGVLMADLAARSFCAVADVGLAGGGTLVSKVML
jgi:hypothetical protein